MMLKLHALSARLSSISGKKINSIVRDNYRSKRKDYRLTLRNFLNHLEVDRVKKLYVAAETDEKLFWKLLKGQRSSS